MSKDLSLFKQLEIQKFINTIDSLSHPQLDETFHLVYPMYQLWTRLEEQISDPEFNLTIDFDAAEPCPIHRELAYISNFKTLSEEDKRAVLIRLFRTALYTQEFVSKELSNKVKSSFTFLKIK